MKKLLLILILPLIAFILTGCNKKTEEYSYCFSDEYMYTAFSQEGIILQTYNGENKEVSIPSVIDGHIVVGMTTDLIDSFISKNVVKVEIPDTVERIISTHQLNAIEFDINAPIFEVENGIVYLDDWVIQIDYKNLNEVIIRDGTRGLRDYMISYGVDQNLIMEKIYIPGSIKIIPAYAVYVLSKSIIIGYGVERIDDFGLVPVAGTSLYIPSSAIIDINAIGNTGFIDIYHSITIVFYIDDKIEEILIYRHDCISLDDITFIESEKIEGIYYDKEFTKKYEGNIIYSQTVFYVKTKL